MLETAVITGASNGIGKSLALQLADAGFRLVLAARSKDKLQAIAKEIQQKGGESLPVPTDVSQPEQIKILKEKALDFGNVSVVVNNAGTGKFSNIENITLADWNRQMDVNLRASFLVSQAFIPAMKQKKKGSLLFINSVAGIKPYAFSTAYVASKFGLRGFSSSLREELREHNIKVMNSYSQSIGFDTKIEIYNSSDSIVETMDFHALNYKNLVIDKYYNFLCVQKLYRRV